MIYINFSAPINDRTTHLLMSVLTNQVNGGENEIYFLFSSPGGSVSAGITLHNFLRSLPVKVTMHNIGIVDSIGNVVFLAAEERYANPNSSFLFHGVGFDINQNTRFEEKNLKEKLTIIKRDQKMITDIIEERTKINENDIIEMFFDAKTKTSDEAKKV